MFKNVRLVILFDMFLNPSFKMTTSSANVAKLAKISNHQDLGLYMKKKLLILNELKASLMLKFSLQSLFLIWCERLPIYGNLK